MEQEIANTDAEHGPKRGPGRPRQFDRDEALRRAMRLFWARGYEMTSMADLREALGLTQASIYAAFGSKERLFLEAVALYRETAGNTTARALEEHATARGAIEAMLRGAVATFLEEDAPGGCMVVLGAVHCSEESRAAREELARFRRETEARVLERLRRGQREGDLPETAPVEAMAGFYTTVLHGLSVQAKDGAPLGGAVTGAMAAWDAMLDNRERGRA